MNIKNILYTISGLFIFAICLNGQQSEIISSVIGKGDSLKLEFKGIYNTIQWQYSSDGENWQDIAGETNATLLAVPTSNSYYKANLNREHCPESNTLSIIIQSNLELELDSLTANEYEILLTQCYIPIRAFYGKEIGYDFSEAGTDLFTWGQNCRSQGFCTYTQINDKEENDRTYALWRELYRGMLNCNYIINKIDNTTLPIGVKTQYKSEASFLRTYYYWLIFETWGEVAFTLDNQPLTQNSLQVKTKTEIYNQIISDLSFAEENILELASWGVVSKVAVEAFKARMYLYNKDYSNALIYAKKVIANTQYNLLDNFSDIWDINNQQNSEIIFAVNNSFNPDPYVNSIQFVYEEESSLNHEAYRFCYREGGHQGHFVYENGYMELNWGMSRDIENGRGFQRWMPTKFLIELFDTDIDQRFKGTFKNVWYCNTSSYIPRWKTLIYIDGKSIDIPDSLWGEHMFNLGDTAIYFSQKIVANSLKATFSLSNNTYFHSQSGFRIIDINDMYFSNGEPNPVIGRQFYFPPTKKLYDNTRSSSFQLYSKRDAVIIRQSEMYLIAAEASLYTTGTTNAYNYLLELANKRAIDKNGASLLQNYGISSDTDTDLDIDFILDERARELTIEQHRWFDLKRTGKLVERVKAHNTDAAPNIQNHHLLRRIPQQAIDNKHYIPQGMEQNTGY